MEDLNQGLSDFKSSTQPLGRFASTEVILLIFTSFGVEQKSQN